MFNNNSGAAEAIDLIPAGTLMRAVLNVRSVMTSQNSGARYLDIELIGVDGPYDNRRVFDIIMDPWDSNASDGARRMGIKNITRICEATGLFKAEDPASYDRYSEESCIADVIEDINGATVAIRVKIDKGTGGHADKNRVASFLTPNPNGGPDFKAWQTLAEGGGAVAPPAARSAPAFGAPGAPAQAGGTPGWLNKPTA